MMQNFPQSCRQPFLWPVALAVCLMFCINNAAQAAGIKFNFPLNCQHNQTCWILNYMDADPRSGAARDFTCGPRSADGYAGTDIAIRDLSSAGGSGLAVLAAADGVVVQALDGVNDRIVTASRLQETSLYPCGNMITLDHGRGWQTSYCHMRQRSIAVRPGQRVRMGQQIGAVGLSGLTTWPKLGFYVTRYGMAYDPFSGRTSLEGCGHSTNSLWRQPDKLPYRAFAIYNLGFDKVAPAEKTLDQGAAVVSALPADTPSLSFWATLFDALKGDVIDMRVTDPDGRELMSVSTTLPDDQKKRLVSLTKNRDNFLWQPGIYTGTIRITRGFGSKKQTSEWTARVMLTQ